MGPSGSGKSTLMHTLAGLDTPTSGSVTIADTEITTLNDDKLTLLRREHIGFVFQFFNLLPMLSAEENIVLPLSIAGEHADGDWLGELLKRTGLTGRSTHRPSELSGGEQQRVAIARALVTRPTILFADEPTGNLDSKTGGEILDLLRDSANAYGQTIVMVTHDPRAASIADRILFIADGRIVNELTGASQADVLVGHGHAAMIRVALKGLLGRKLRAALTAVAIVLGVAMVERHVCAHRHDQVGVFDGVHVRLQEHRRCDHRQERDRRLQRWREPGHDANHAGVTARARSVTSGRRPRDRRRI